MNKKILTYFLIGLVLVAIFIFTGAFGNVYAPKAPERTLDLPSRNDTVPAVPFLYNYDNKIVYTTDTTIEKDIYVDDCATRGGVFNVCGNTCEPTAQNCTTVCALTCNIK